MGCWTRRFWRVAKRQAAGAVQLVLTLGGAAPFRVKGAGFAFPPPSLPKFFRPFPGGVKNRENPHFFLLYPVSDEERRP